MNATIRPGTVGTRRRALLLAIYGLGALGIGVALAAAPGGAAPAPSPASLPVVTPANKAAAEAQYSKASALYAQKKYAEAQVENDKALQLDPTNVNAVLMQGTLKRYLAGGAASQGAATSAGKIPLLTLPQVSMIRLMELGPGDARVVGKIDVKSLEDFWQNVVLKDQMSDKTKAAHDAFINPGNFPVQVARIRDSHDLKYMQMITLNTDPAVYTYYNNNVKNYVLASCATAECHGGEKAPGGNFRLVTPATTVEQLYTNFFILSQYANADGKMIDRENPDKSLLLQYGLPWVNATIRHPKVEARRLSGLNDPRLQTMTNWIRTLALPKPNYGISYEVPGAAATMPATASAPATTAATTAATAPK